LSKKFATAIKVTIKQSKHLNQVIVIIHVLAIISCMHNSLPLPDKLMLVVLVGINLYFNIAKYNTQFKAFSINYEDALGWQITDINQNFQAIQILPSSVITANLIVLHFLDHKQKSQQKIIFYDALNASDYRSLLVTLKLAWQWKSEQTI